MNSGEEEVLLDDACCGCAFLYLANKVTVQWINSAHLESNHEQ